eukprot:TRINITY_DN2371_c0_g1_i1.p1 TRINITY_DN2371_c0_g1~~TRINITY_DN2371_c0_g1_i1.p1  ORF type:complete len:490 (-),score=145.19 TRINITY_DN2371_c0_g1_i1:479-1837(-)
MSSEVTVEGGHSTQPENTKHNTVPLEGKELRDALKKQVEYYFSKENLVTDRYLVSQMNSETFVPVKVIANFKQIKNLTTDLDLLVSVMKECHGVELDSSSQMIKPSIKPTRNTLILREIPSSTPLQEIKAMFEGEGHGKVSEIKPEIGDMWYVTFESDKGALDSLEKLRSQTFQDKPIRCRLKTESTFRSISLSATNIPMPVPIEASAQSFVQGVFYPGAKSNDGTNKKGRGGNAGNSTGGRKNASGSPGATGGKKGAKGPKTAAEVAAPRKRSTSKVELGVNNFPPLSNADAKQAGYTESFQKWERQDFLNVLEGEVAKPEGLKEDAKESAAVIVSTPNKELEITKPTTKKVDSKSAWGSEPHSIEKVMSPPPKPTPNSKVTVSLTPAASAQASSSHPQQSSPTKPPKQNEEKKEEEPAQKPKENNSNTSTGPAAGTWASVLTSNKVADRT